MEYGKKSGKGNMYRIHEVKLKIDETVSDDKKEKALKIKIAEKAKIKVSDIKNHVIVRESIDARDKQNIRLVYTLDFACNKKLKLPKAPDMTYHFKDGAYPKDKRPVVVGFGPCGMFAALTLIQMGYRPIVLERGKKVEERSKDVEKFWSLGILNEESNVQFGEGGAGTFSDGKLTTGIKDIRIRKVLEEFHRFGANEDILYKQKPHIGTDVLKKVVASIRKYIVENGGDIRFSSKVTGITTEEGHLKSIEIKNNEKIYTLECDRAIFALGHSARDTFRMMYDKGIHMEQKPFSIGVRIEHPQKVIDKAQYGNDEYVKYLGAADYKLNYRTNEGRGVYTFCMCPGGVVVMASSSEGQVVTNGMSYHARDGKFANSAVLVDVRTEDFGSKHPLAGIDFQEKYERKAFQVHNGYKFPECLWKDFENSNVAECLPQFVSRAISEAVPQMAKKLKGFDMPEAVVRAVESRSSSPVRISRNENMQSNIAGLYPAGEGAGYAGGIVSAAVDGIKAAEKITE